MRQSPLVSSVKPLAASNWFGKVFGQYDFQGVRNGYPYYKQRHTVNNNTEVCQIFRKKSTDSEIQKTIWYMGRDNNEEDYLYHTISSVSVPRYRWTIREQGTIYDCDVSYDDDDV